MSTNTNLIKGISEQYGAALKMLENIITECNDDLWQDSTQKIVVPQVVYHAISSTDFYLSRTKAESESFKDKFGPDDGTFHDPNLKLTKNELSDYLEEVKQKATKRFNEITSEELNKEPIFDWHGTSVLGSLLYNLRHTMLHVGALHVRLNAVSEEPLRWVSKIYGDERDQREELNGRGVNYLQQGKLDEAEKIYLELTNNSKDPLFFYNLACCYSLQSKPEKALETLRTCLKFDTNNRFKGLAPKDKDFASIKNLPAFNELFN